MQNFKDLRVWEKSHQFTLKVYKLTSNFPKIEIYGLSLQMRRAAYSVPANIAEGCGKSSQNELAHFSNISLGSANESEYFLILAKDLEYLSPEEFLVLSGDINEVKAMLIALVNKIRNKPNT